MNVYFTASIVGKKDHLNNYVRIISHLSTLKHIVISDHIINHSEQQINLQSKSDRESFHKKLKKWIIDSDAVVVEGSFPSISVGFEISLALNLGKPVLLLYKTEAPTLFQSYDNDRLVCERYTSGNYKDILEDFLNYAEGKNDHRFTFFINSKIADHLETVSKKRGLPKSVYLRRLIEKDMSS